MWSRQSSAREGSFTSARLRVVLKKPLPVVKGSCRRPIGGIDGHPPSSLRCSITQLQVARSAATAPDGDPYSGAGLWNEDGLRRRTGCAVPTLSAWKLLPGVAPDVGGVEAEDRSSRRSQQRCSLSQPSRSQRTHHPNSRRRRQRSRVPALIPSRPLSHRQLTQRRPSRVRRLSMLLLHRSHLPRRNRRRFRRSRATRMTTRLAEQ